MTEFNGRPSRAYLAAVDALKRLSLDDRNRAYADSSAADLRALAVRQGGQKLSGKKSWRRLLGKSAQFRDSLPGDDHVELRRGANLTYISHPYGLAFGDLKEIVEACEANGLEAHIDARSWYFPGSTLRVTYRVNSIRKRN